MSQINYDPLHTFDKPSEEDEHISTPFAAILNDKYPAITFVESLFDAKPHMFGNFAASLVYILNSGISYKPDVVYNLFEQYIKYAPQLICRVMKQRSIGVYEFCPNFVVLWAKILKHTKTTIAFEPVMKDLNAVLNEFFVNKKVNINGINYDLGSFKPLCYTRTGESYFTLLPYIVYVMTFLIHCSPYSFNEAQSESSRFGFLSSVNDYFQRYITAFKEDTQIDLLKTNVDGLDASISEKYVSEMIQSMLHPDNVIKLRNDEIEKTPELLDECIHDQMAIGKDVIKKGFNLVLTRVIKIIIQQNPIKRIFDLIPAFKADAKVNARELFTWTNYCLGGGDKPFVIESGDNKKILKKYTVNALDDEQHKREALPSFICDKQSISSNITPLTICRKAPLTEYDLMLNMCTAYVKKNFEHKRTDILDDDPLRVSEEDLHNKDVAVTLRNLFINGIWSYDNTSMSTILTRLQSLNAGFVSEVKDIIALMNVTLMIYNNRLASTILPTLLLSHLNEWLLQHVVNGCNLEIFSPFTYITKMSVDPERIYKLCDMTTSLLYIMSDKYAKFVNDMAKEFVSIIAHDHVIQQPYVKHLSDLADIYAIGGCELYRWAENENPLVRGSMWHYNVFGWNEQLECFYAWASKLSNSSLMELIETNLSDVNVIESALKIQLEKLIQAKAQPIMLSNYEFDELLKYKEKKRAYVLEYVTSVHGKDVSVVSAVIKRIFKRTLANQATTESVWFKRIICKGSTELVATKAHKNSMSFGEDGKTLPAHISEVGISLIAPVYDISGKVDEVKVLYTSPPGFRLETLTLGNSRNNENQTILLYTTTPAKTRFTKHSL